MVRTWLGGRPVAELHSGSVTEIVRRFVNGFVNVTRPRPTLQAQQNLTTRWPIPPMTCDDSQGLARPREPGRIEGLVPARA